MAINLQLITKDELIKKFREIERMGWVRNQRYGNDGGVGNTLEDLLGIPENNLPIPNAAEWELKARRSNTSSLVTLCHQEPSPRAAKLVPEMLLPHYGWRHREAGKKYPETEMSFRMTLNGLDFMDRGFKINVNRDEQRVEIVFDPDYTDSRHSKWLDDIRRCVGLGPLPVTPYWGFNDLYTKIGTKLLNCFFVQAEVKKIDGEEYYHYNDVLMCKTVDLGRFIEAIERGIVLIDFDARTGHNHGTKFRIKDYNVPYLYRTVEKVI